MVSNEFDQIINKYNTHKSKLVIITHPVERKNKDILEKADSYLNKNLDRDLLVYSYNGLNQAENFKVPKKLPTVMFWKGGIRPDENPVEISRFEMLHNSEENALDQSSFEKSIKKLIRENSNRK